MKDYRVYFANGDYVACSSLFGAFGAAEHGYSLMLHMRGYPRVKRNRWIPTRVTLFVDEQERETEYVPPPQD